MKIKTSKDLTGYHLGFGMDGPIKFTGTFGDSELRHLLRRTLFGVTAEDMELFRGMSLDDVVESLLTFLDFPSPPPVNNYRVFIEDKDVPYGETWIRSRAGWANEEEDDPDTIVVSRLDSLRGWLINNMITQPPTLHHKLLLFWHNHLAVDAFVPFIAKSTYQYYKLLWNQSMGNFKTLMREITIDPSMLIFLNGTENIKDAPDENYSRELQELFCIGKGENAQFTEGDVQEAARVLTGWGVKWETAENEGEIESAFFDFNHETRDKVFSDFYDNKVIKGRSGMDGQAELDDLIEMVVTNAETARFICRKLHRFFISPAIDVEVENNFIEPLAELFIASNYELKPLLRSFFTSDYFFDSQVRGAIIKSPADMLIGFLRSNKVNYITDPGNLDKEFWVLIMFGNSLLDMGYLLGNPPSVSGWPAYYQLPAYDKAWITTFTLISRIIVTDTYTNDGFWTPAERIPWDFLSFTMTLQNPDDPDLLLQEVFDLNLAQPLDSDTTDNLKSILLGGQPQNYYWTNAWNDYIGDPSDPIKKEVVETRLRFFYTSFFQQPEFQLM